MSRISLALTIVAVACSALVAGQDGGGGRGRGAAPVSLPEGNGRELVQTTCTKCHGLNLITNSWGYTKQGWDAVITSMVAVPAADRAVVSEYLAAHFPEKPRPRAVV